ASIGEEATEVEDLGLAECGEAVAPEVEEGRPEEVDAVQRDGAGFGDHVHGGASLQLPREAPESRGAGVPAAAMTSERRHEAGGIPECAADTGPHGEARGGGSEQGAATEGARHAGGYIPVSSRCI